MSAGPAPVLRKDIDTGRLLQLLPRAENIDYWRALCPGLAITDYPFEPWDDSPLAAGQRAAYREQLLEEGYFQTPPILDETMRRQMLTAIENVREAGFPTTFALVYDVFFQAFSRLAPTLRAALGDGFRLIPNFWLYYIEPTDNGKGFEPHRDAEYLGTLDEHGMPSVITTWITITEATPLNSCMYLLPRNRDPQYNAAVHNLKTGWNELALEDLRAIPTPAGTLSCWDQYVFHYGSRSSKRAPQPRVSIAAYCQRGDIPPVDDRFIELPSRLDFQSRLAIACRGLRRYSYVSFRQSEQGEQLLSILDRLSL